MSFLPLNLDKKKKKINDLKISLWSTWLCEMCKLCKNDMCLSESVCILVVSLVAIYFLTPYRSFVSEPTTC